MMEYPNAMQVRRSAGVVVVADEETRGGKQTNGDHEVG